MNPQELGRAVTTPPAQAKTREVPTVNGQPPVIQVAPAPRVVPAKVDLTVGGLGPGQKVFSRFELLEILGQGGMGVIWLAHDESLDRKLALKFVPELVRHDPTAMDDLKHEARRCLDLTHPRIVRVYDFLSDLDHAAIAMEFVPTQTLGVRLREQPQGVFEVSELRELMGQLCDALAYAHESGAVVHRDLKPSNLMHSRELGLKVVDFGVARSLLNSISRLTAPGTISGTLAYMSPQQMLGEPPRKADDIYSLGATVYHLLTGRPPFYEGDLPTQVSQVTPPPMEVRRQQLGVRARERIPKLWEHVVAACLEKDPNQRPNSVQQVGERLRLTVSKEQVRVPPAGRAQRRRLAVAAGGLLAGFGVALGMAWAWKVGPLRQQLEGGVATLKATEARLLAAEGRLAEAGLAPPAGLAPVGMAWIPPGSFLLGSPPGEKGQSPGEEPQTQVSLTQGFFAGQFEVTQAEYEALLGPNPSEVKGDSSLPVHNVSWIEANRYCLKLTERERAVGRLPLGWTYRLPTEAEWEYVCRAGATNQFCYGDDPNYARLGDYAWYRENAGGSPRKVGQRQPNRWRLYDLHGNVWEWCLDWHGDYRGGNVADPTGPVSGSGRVIRGGGWNDGGQYCRSATRMRSAPDQASKAVGFRVVLARTAR